mmetsp:Transcript_4734/g.8102  ORF Transcript_4734/g.8102 Transcript_4734/m.8102 type:complete len:349 (-) Transcript_4734:304-1350(-)|eukprot:CAMPEP_0198197290 /NCGR_PEP_ID=MMETSP1445-20131203/886_1 /TAXON_ID=36898 /ORGANISM="Pyramimonas sp., Strain CCMP2087" /LENGTH=348 /DNA_ID=CAMNT_0043866529 /DNA_START=1368 /DNA_END=2414 /DNA_ORIENTATION=-
MSGPTRGHKIAGACLLTLLTSSGGILMQLSKTDGMYLYNSATVPFLAEVLKLFISLATIGISHLVGAKPLKMTMDWTVMVKYAVPSILYMIANNLSLEILKYLRPSTYQILGNLRIVTTGLLTVTLLGRSLARIQWVALIMMTVGAATSQLGEGAEASKYSSNPLIGYALSFLLCLVASLAGVYTERVMKGNDDSIHWQNTQLYGFGVIFNIIRLSVDDAASAYHNGFWMITLLHGYSTTTWLVVCNLAFSGLLVSFIMKYVDVIAKNFSTASAMFLTPIAALPLFGHSPTLSLLLGAIIAALSLFLFYAKKDDLFNVSEREFAALNVRQEPEDPNPLGLPQQKSSLS